MRVLGIESSCDETAVAIVDNGTTVVSSSIASSMNIHAKYGGVVPEIAARSHIEAITAVIDEALRASIADSTELIANSQTKKSQNSDSKLPTTSYKLQAIEDPWSSIDGIAVTVGAGLSGSLLIGVLTARTLVIIKNKPLYAINHVEAHVYANFLLDLCKSVAATGLDSSEIKTVLSKKKVVVATSKEEKLFLAVRNRPKGLGDLHKSGITTPAPRFPLLALIVSGGHSQLVLFKDHFDYTLLGQTRDDAVGEAFDKVAKIIGLPYPGGPSVAKAAELGNPLAYDLPIAKVEGSYNFSFSGLKTAVLRAAQTTAGGDFRTPSTDLPALLTEQQKNDIAASFQRVAVQTLTDKTLAAFNEYQPASVVIAGGVAANTALRQRLTEVLPIPITYAPFNLCTDNGAMVASLGCFKAMRGIAPDDPYSLAIDPNLKM